MLKKISGLGWCYATYGLLTCGYFCSAAVGGWRFPDVLSVFDGVGGGGGGSSYSSGSTYGRGSGGSWGGGK